MAMTTRRKRARMVSATRSMYGRAQMLGLNERSSQRHRDGIALRRTSTAIRIIL